MHHVSDQFQVIPICITRNIDKFDITTIVGRSAVIFPLPCLRLSGLLSSCLYPITNHPKLAKVSFPLARKQVARQQIQLRLSWAIQPWVTPLPPSLHFHHQDMVSCKVVDFYQMKAFEECSNAMHLPGHLKLISARESYGMATLISELTTSL